MSGHAGTRAREGTSTGAAGGPTVQVAQQLPERDPVAAEVLAPNQRLVVDLALRPRQPNSALRHAAARGNAGPTSSARTDDKP